MKSVCEWSNVRSLIGAIFSVRPLCSVWHSLHARCSLNRPLKPFVGHDILADVVVAIETEGRLCRFVESLMAGGAGLFPLDMSLDHLTRHQCRFNSFGRS